jgi:hypothetical protein
MQSVPAVVSSNHASWRGLLDTTLCDNKFVNDLMEVGYLAFNSYKGKSKLLVSMNNQRGL